MADPSFPVPAGLEVPDLAEGETIDFVTTYTVSGGTMTPIAVEDKTIAESEEDEQEEAPAEGESFGAAVEKRMGGMP